MTNPVESRSGKPVSFSAYHLQRTVALFSGRHHLDCWVLFLPWRARIQVCGPEIVHLGYLSWITPVFSVVTTSYDSSVIRLFGIVISDAELVAAIQAIGSEDLIPVVDFTTVLNERETPQAVGFIVKLSEPLGAFLQCMQE